MDKGTPKEKLKDISDTLKSEIKAEALDVEIILNKFGEIQSSFEINSIKFRIFTKTDEKQIQVNVRSLTATGKRHLRNSLVGRYPMSNDEFEYHTLGSISQRSTQRKIVTTLIACHRQLMDEGTNLLSVVSPEQGLGVNQIPLFWWDKRPNFGDAIGPWIANQISGKIPLNARGAKIKASPLMVVGSILGQIEQDGTSVWGSGLIEPLSPSRIERLKGFKDIKIHAVRGRYTRDELVKHLGWQVPEVFGDPALLLPRFIKPNGTERSVNKISIIPHYAHRQYFPEKFSENLHCINVEEGLERVVREIASSKAVISTSLHGIIIAQAYGVPWTWLRITDSALMGDEFKFNDFFSTLKTDDISRVDVSSDEVANLNFELIAKKSSINSLSISLDDLASSFPKPKKIGTVTLSSRVSFISRRIGKIARRTLRDPDVPQKIEIISNKDKLNLNILSDILPELKKMSTLLEESLAEQRKQRRLLDVARLQISAGMYSEIRERVGRNQLTLRKTLERLANSNDSFARFGDGEFRLLGHPEENLSFQRNSIELRNELADTLRAANKDGLMVGFPHIYIDSNWSRIWSEIWYQVNDFFDESVVYADSHVTRPIAFKQLGSEATQLWRSVWEGKDVCIVTGKNSRFELSPELFDSVASSITVESSAKDGFEDISRVMDELKMIDCDMVLIALGPAGTVLARKLHEVGTRALDIGHLSDSHANVFLDAARPEAKPIEK